MWASVLQLLLSLASAIASHIREKRLLDAGAAEATLKGIRDADEAIRRARAARDNVQHDADSVQSDEHNRDNW